MFNIKELNKAVEQLAAEKDIQAGQIFEAVEAALASAYKKEFNKRGEVIKCDLNAKDGSVNFCQIRTVVDDTTVRFPKEGQTEEEQAAELEAMSEEEREALLPLYNEERHILLKEAQEVKPDTFVGDELCFSVEQPQADFGRIAAQTAKQVVLQKIREIEKDAVKREYDNKVGELISGIVQRVERGNVYVDLGKTSGVMFFSEAIPGEHYRIGERLKFYLLNVHESSKGPNLILSRSHPRFVVKLFELEVPEVNDGVVEIKGIVREAGSRTKIAVYATAEGVDPVGSCVGQRGARVMAVNSELGNEKIDIIEWSDDSEKFITSALSPATATSIEELGPREVRVLVPEDQLSLAIGKGGQNVRLAAKLTGYKIDIRSQANPDQVQDGGVSADEEQSASDENEEE
jgi:N utilization substance protein A